MSDGYVETEPVAEEGFAPEPSPTSPAYETYTPPYGSQILTRPDALGVQLISTPHHHGNPALAPFITGPLFVGLGIVFLCIAAFVTEWTGSGDLIPTSPDEAAAVGRTVFAVMGGIFTLAGAAISLIAIRVRRLRDPNPKCRSPWSRPAPR